MTYFWPLFVLLLVVFAAMLIVLRYVLGRHYLAATARLQSLGAEYSRRHEELKQRAEEAEQQYQEQMAKAKTEAEQVLLAARQEASATRAKSLEDARLESERIVQQALETRDALRKEIEQTMEARAIERACELLQAALPEPLRREIQSRWLEELMRNGAAQLDRLKTDEPVTEARIACAFPLTTEQRSALRDKLQMTLGQAIAVSEETDHRLVAGLTITVGSRILDASLASRLQQAARRARDRGGE
jgi:F-type H+-transporting ATPase subunit delta